MLARSANQRHGASTHFAAVWESPESSGFRAVGISRYSRSPISLLSKAAGSHDGARAPWRASKRTCAQTTSWVVKARSHAKSARISRPKKASGDHRETSHPLQSAKPVSAQNHISKVKEKPSQTGQETSGAASAPATAAGSGLASGSRGKVTRSFFLLTCSSAAAGHRFREKFARRFPGRLCDGKRRF